MDSPCPPCHNGHDLTQLAQKTETIWPFCMHLILAENLNGWIFAAGILLGGLIATVLALCALAPAWQRNRRLTVILIAPALVIGMLITIWLGYGFITDGLHDPDSSVSDFVLLWLLMAGPPLATSLLAIVVLVFSSRRVTDI